VLGICLVMARHRLHRITTLVSFGIADSPKPGTIRETIEGATRFDALVAARTLASSLPELTPQGRYATCQARHGAIARPDAGWVTTLATGLAQSRPPHCGVRFRSERQSIRSRRRYNSRGALLSLAGSWRGFTIP
jgi:hypothetical protein